MITQQVYLEYHMYYSQITSHKSLVLEVVEGERIR